MFKNKVTWILFIILSVVCSIAAYYTFPKAFPILTIDLKMSRDDALEKAVTLSKEFGYGSENAHTVATFGVDNEAQTFIELDQGGAKKFIEVLDNKYYEAYTWQVRLYEPGNVNEAWFTFTPEGKFYGLYEKLPEDLYIESLSDVRALKLARNIAENDWNIDFLNYELVEKSQERKPSERIDHTFVYKRNDISLGDEGEYRLELALSGTKLTTIKYFIKVPESFNRIYEEMRSSNNTIAQVASYAMFIFYLLGGIIGGLFLLNRQRWLLWKSAIYWAIFVAVMMLLSNINFLPLSWLGYDTAISTQNFILQKVLINIVNLIVMLIYLTLSFVAAESLTRKAFPNHINFWNLWSKNNAASNEVFGRTIAGYLLIGFDLFFVIFFYTITATYFGWWTPSGPLFSPDMIATPFPWLTAIGMSLHAGFWEECLFRAIPLAGAALIGQKYGKKTLFISIAMIIQAVIFAAAHASYPSVPAYSRLVELMIPSLVWGFIYLKFGLLPVIIMHFGYDVVWFSLPLFVSDSSDVFFGKIMVLLLVFLPLWIVVVARIRSGRFFTLDSNFYNSAFKAPKIIQTTKDTVREISSEINKNYKYILYALTIIGVFLLYQYPSKSYSNLNLDISRSEALELSDEYLNNNQISFDDEWTQLSQLYYGNIDIQDRFIWEKEGSELYHSIIGQYLDNALWNIRYVRFEGEVNDKTEEYSVLINHDGSLNQIRHKLPENATGKRLDERKARLIAINYINASLNLSKNQIEEISSEPSNLPNRDDWEFIYQDISSYNLSSDGELRIKVNISGDEVVSTNRYVYVPEEWEREDKNNQTFLNLFATGSFFLIVFFIIYAAAVSIGKWSKGKFNLQAFKYSLLLLFPLGVLNIINDYPSTISYFSTAKPFTNQLLTDMGGSIIFISILAFMLSAIIGNSSKSLNTPNYRFSIFEILLLSVTTLGFLKFCLHTEQLAPYWMPMHSVNSFIPVFGELNDNIHKFLNKSIILIFVFTIINSLTDNGSKKHYLYIIILLLFSFIYNGSTIMEPSGAGSINQWLYISISFGIFIIVLYKQFISYNLSIVPLLLSIITVFQLIGTSMLNSYPSLLIGNILSAVIVLLLGYSFKIYLDKS